jgi:L-threonylcarbamoyladenylate synthase
MKGMSDSTRRTRLLPATPANIALAAATLRGEGLVAFPTETVYGLGADAENSSAVRAMFSAKGRPADHPVIVHLAGAEHIEAWAREVPPVARTLAAAFWPGPMTLVLRRSSRARDFVTGGLDTVGLRVPSHPVARALLAAFGGAIAAPSANRFGRVSPTTAQHVLAELDGHIDLILDGGPCIVGLESTIIDLTGEQPAILRPGGVTAEQIAAALGVPIVSGRHNAPRVSGNLESHYAPRARVEIVTSEELISRAFKLAATGLKVAIIADACDNFTTDEEFVHIALPADETKRARSLYAALRLVDEVGCDVALTTLLQEAGLGVAIADRLRRAAGPRPQP